MKALQLAVGAAVVGAAIGAAVGYVRVGPPQDPEAIRAALAFDTGGASRPPAGAGQGAPRPRLVVEQPTYGFGTMQRGAKQRHEFVVRNEGDAPLHLTPGEPSCKCTAFEPSADTVPPGGSVRVALEWVARTMPGPFRQTGPLHTNDPSKPVVELAIEGQVVEPSGLTPISFEMGDVAAGDAGAASVLYYVTDDRPIELTASPPTREEANGKFTVEVEPADPADLADQNAVAGRRITLRSKPGLPVGQIMEWVKLRIGDPDGADAEEIEVPVMGRVVGDITVHGGRWNDEAGVLNLGIVPRDQGAESRLLLSVKGQHAADTRFEVKAVDPPELSVKIGETQLRADDVYHTYITVEVPKGTRPMVRLNTPQGDDGLVRLSATHPGSPEVVLRVRFAVSE